MATPLRPTPPAHPEVRVGAARAADALDLASLPLTRSGGALPRGVCDALRTGTPLRRRGDGAATRRGDVDGDDHRRRLAGAQRRHRDGCRPPCGATDLARHGDLYGRRTALERVPQRRALEAALGARGRIRQLGVRAGDRPRRAWCPYAPVRAIGGERGATGPAGRTRPADRHRDATTADADRGRARCAARACHRRRRHEDRAAEAAVRTQHPDQAGQAHPAAGHRHDGPHQGWSHPRPSGHRKLHADRRGVHRRHLDRRRRGDPGDRIQPRPRGLPRRMAHGVRRRRAAIRCQAGLRRFPGSTSAASSSRRAACCARSGSRRDVSPRTSRASRWRQR